jgi:hypothetical protein
LSEENCVLPAKSYSESCASAGRQIDLETAEEIASSTDGNIAQILLAGRPKAFMRRLISYLKQRLGDDQAMIYVMAGEVLISSRRSCNIFCCTPLSCPEMTVEMCNELLEITNAQACIDELISKIYSS